MRTSFHLLSMALLAAAPIAAMDQPGPAPAADSLEAWLQKHAADQAWIFAPAAGRIDPWYAYTADEAAGDSLIDIHPPTRPDLTARLQQIERDLTAHLAAHRWSDALGAADAAKNLAAAADAITPVQQRALDRIAAFRAQAEAGRAYDDAHARFAAQDIKIQGILWSADGAPLAMVDGETRVLAIGDQVKDWSISAIDRDRVVFRSHVGNPYEFTCFIGEDAN